MKHIYGMRKIRSGFTLLELLIAVTIFAIAAVALYSSFYAGIRILRRSEEAMKRHQDLRLVTEEMALDLRNSMLAPIYEEKRETTSVETEGAEEEIVYFFLGEEKRFSFVTLRDALSTDAKLKRQICNVTYYLKGGSDTGGKLARIIKYQSKGYGAGLDEEEILLTGLEDIEVNYSFQGADEDSPPIWLNRWEVEERVPLGVKIKLKLKGLGTLREFTKTVFIPVGLLGSEEESAI